MNFDYMLAQTENAVNHNIQKTKKEKLDNE